MADELGIMGYLYLEREVGGLLKGESQDTYHLDEIQLVSYSFGVSTPDAGKTDAGAAGGKSGTTPQKSKSDPQPVVFSTVFGKSSPDLFLMAARGDAIKAAWLYIRRLGSRSKEDADYIMIGFIDAYITDYKISGGEGPRPTETFTLHVQTIDMAYRQQDEKGKLAAPIGRAFTWDGNKAVTTVWT